MANDFGSGIMDTGINFMYYDTDIFESENKLKGKLACNKTFLLNKDNEIVLVGEPFGREKITKLYQKYIGSLNIEYHDSVAE